MSAYPWLQRHKRYLSFRYLFPRAAAVWIQWRRLLLRIVWFFTLSVDELLNGLRDALLWPWHRLEHVGRWISEAVQWSALAIYEFFRDFIHGLDWSLHWLGRLPVWTGASLAGVMGIMLTLVLFLLPSLKTPPVVASIAATTSQQAAPPQPLFASRPTLHAYPERAPAAQDEFDIFAEPDPTPTPTDDWPAVPRHLPVRQYGEPRLVTELSRLSLPLDRRQRIHVASESLAVPRRQRWSGFDRFATRDGWSTPRLDRIRQGIEFSPYASRLDPRLKSRTPRWIAPQADVPPTSPFAGLRQPAVVVEKSAPATAAVGRPLQYSLIVKNLSNERLESVTVREQVSAIERVSNVHPSANVVGDELVWDVAELRPGEHRRLQVELIPNERMTLAHKTTVEVTTGVAVVSDAHHPHPVASAPRSDTASQPAQRERQPAPQMILPGVDRAPSALSIRDAEPAAQPIPKAAPIRDDPQPELFPWDSDPSSGPPPQDEPPLDGSLVLPPAASSPKELPNTDTRADERDDPGNPRGGRNKPPAATPTVLPNPDQRADDRDVPGTPFGGRGKRPAATPTVLTNADQRADDRDAPGKPFGGRSRPPAAAEESPDISTKNKPKPPAATDTLTLAMQTPTVASSGSDVRTIFEVHNRGRTDLRDLVLTVELSRELQHKKGRTLELRIDRLPAGQTYRTRLTTQAVRDGKASLASKVTSPETRQQTARRAIRISRNVARSANLAFGVPRVYHIHPRCVPRRF